MKNLKVSSLFHWLYGAVMFLPILLLPVFMIYSHRHTIDSGTLDVPQQEIIDFNQLYDYRLVNTQEINGIHFDNLNNGYYHIYGTATDYADLVYPTVYEYQGDPIVVASYSSNTVTCRFASLNGTYSDDLGRFILNTQTQYYLRVEPNTTLDIIFAPQIFNLTKMFGFGNEPSNSDFKAYFPNDYYSFASSRKELLEVGTITYNDTDIMSQATYQLYNATDKYFNIGQFFGLENLWNYMVLNWFGGNVTIYLRIFWQLLTYWLVVSIAWLIFDLFMYVPKLAHRWLDRSAIE